MKTIEQCREISARIWCDKDYSDIVMNVDLAEEIAQLLHKEANRDGEITRKESWQ